MRKKIVFFHLLNNFTGSPQILSSVIHAAQKEGYEVKLYTSRTEGFLSKIASESNYYKRSNLRILTLFSFFFSQFLLAFKLLFSNNREEEIFYINTILPFGAILMGRLLRKRVITHVHEYEISPKLLSNFLFWIVRNFSSEVIVVSKFLKANPSLTGATVDVIYNCVTHDFESKAKLFDKNAKDFNVLMLASLRAYKGLGEFIELALKVPKVSFTLVLSDDQEEVEQFKSSQIMPPNISIFPVQRDVHAFYAKASLILNLAHPDKWVETFGMTVLEGMYYELPAIVPNVGGITELVESELNGFQINYDELDKIAEQIQRMSEHPEYWENLSRGAVLTKSRFMRAVFEAQIIKLLNE